MKNKLKIDYDLENSPLQIKTNSVVGSDEELRVKYFDDEGGKAGGITLFFTSNPTYALWFCSSGNEFLTELPTETDKSSIWIREVVKIEFTKMNTAADFYRSGEDISPQEMRKHIVETKFKPNKKFQYLKFQHIRFKYHVLLFSYSLQV